MSNNNPPDNELRIDVRKVFREKNPGMAKMVPGFIYRYIERIVHQDFVNGFLERHGHKKGVDFIHAVIEEFSMDLDIRGYENIPGKGRFIFASNHPLGGFDGIVLIEIVSRKYPQVKFLVNDILMNIGPLADHFVAINKHGGQSREVIKDLEEIYKSDTQVLTFPSGYVSRKINGVVQDLPWQKNFIGKAVQFERDIIPVHFSGRNTNFFYNLANIRKFLRIKWNLEMFYLVDETYRHRNKTITITFGKSIPYQTFDRSRTHLEWADEIRSVVYSLPTNKE
jgi:putative hemolysin